MGPGNGFSRGPQNELFSAWRPPTGTPAGWNSARAPYSTRRRGEKADIASFQSPPGFAPENGLWALVYWLSAFPVPRFSWLWRPGLPPARLANTGPYDAGRRNRQDQG